MTVSLAIAQVLASKFTPLEEQEFMAICRHWQDKHGEDPMLNFKVGEWILQNIHDNMPFNSCPPRDAIHEVFKRVLARAQPSLTADDEHDLSHAITEAKKDFNFGIWLKLCEILTSIAELQLDKALEQNLTLGRHNIIPARTALLEIFRQ